MERIDASSPTKKSQLIDYVRQVFADVLRGRKVKAPIWVNEILRLYAWAKVGVLPDNRGLNYNNAWLLEAFEALNEEEARYMTEQLPDRQRPLPTPEVKTEAVKSAERLIAQVVDKLIHGE